MLPQACGVSRSGGLIPRQHYWFGNETGVPSSLLVHHLSQDLVNISDLNVWTESRGLSVCGKVVHIGWNVYGSPEFVLEGSGPELKYQTRTEVYNLNPTNPF